MGRHENPKTLSGIETKDNSALMAIAVGHENPKTLSGIETTCGPSFLRMARSRQGTKTLKPYQGLKRVVLSSIKPKIEIQRARKP